MDIDEQRRRDRTLLLDEELPRVAGRRLLDRLSALRVFARSAWEDAVETLDDEPLANAVPDLKSMAFDTLRGVVAVIDAAYDAADALHARRSARSVPISAIPSTPAGRVCDRD